MRELLLPTLMLLMCSVAEAQTNLVGNPGFEVNTTGWTTTAPATLSRVSGGHSGGYQALVINSGSKEVRNEIEAPASLESLVYWTGSASSSY